MGNLCVQDRPRLSISIPTYNRSFCLERLLNILCEQAANEPAVEIIVSDNASTDDTPQIVESFIRRGMKFRYIRNPVNVGGDENIRRCYSIAKGEYVWVFGDDDVIAPGALRRILALIENSEYDLLFLAPYHFPGKSSDFLPKPRFWRNVANVTADPIRLTDLVDCHSDFIFITSLIINTHCIPTLPDDLASFVAGSVVQLAWILPVLQKMKRGIFIDAQLIGRATENEAGGFDAADFYGSRFKHAIDSWLPHGSPLARRLINNHLTMWAFNWLEWQWHSFSKEEIAVVNPSKKLKSVYGDNPRYWICVYPLLVLPEFLARAWAFPWMARRKLLRLWYETVTPSVRIG